jgi:cytochrome P450
MIGALCQPGATSLSAEQVYMSCIDFVVAGYLSTTWLVASAINSLLAQGDQWQALLADPSKRDRALEEVLRFEPPFQLVDRFVAQDTVLADVELKRGDTVTAVVGSANRDHAKFDDPDVLDIERDSTAALTFGGGIHYCIGAPLARIMAPAMLGELMKLPALALAGQPQWGTDPYMRAITNLPLSFQPS